MTRYFKAFVTGRPLSVGGRSFIFEPVEPMGGSWAGVLAVDDESTASVLADAGYEITEERYNQLKKKVTPAGIAPAFVPLQQPKAPRSAIVESVGRAVDRTAFASETAAKAEVAAPSVILATTTKQPPFEPLLEPAPVKRRRAA
jgi:hypothetical protein